MFPERVSLRHIDNTAGGSKLQNPKTLKPGVAASRYSFWTLLDTFGHFWTLLDTFGHFWTLLDTFGHFCAYRYTSHLPSSDVLGDVS
jgi:hypothetical protein